jgi:outer membrane protein OmpA-like peptidoglycan-associated protein
MPLAAGAQTVTGLYVGAGAGVNLFMDSDVSLSVPGLAPGRRNGSVEADPGFVGALSLGYGYGNGLRAELELSYRESNVDQVSGFGLPAASAITGDVRSVGFMLNALYDLDLGLPVIPYAGIGAGVVLHDYKRVNQQAIGSDVSIPGSDWVFAYQAILGAALPISEYPGLSLTAEYRFMGSLNPDLTAVVQTGPTQLSGTAETENYNHSIMLGLRYNFGVAPPPVVAPAPAAAPAPARTFLVFFDWNRADLTDRAKQIIAEAAQNSTRVQTTRIEVSGHADRSGTPQYNQRLSERRAQAVAAELEARGVPRTAMVIQAFGESRPLVPTADGVREPQNRRVEIVLR